jgi:hypothetical protein
MVRVGFAWPDVGFGWGGAEMPRSYISLAVNITTVQSFIYCFYCDDFRNSYNNN